MGTQTMWSVINAQDLRNETDGMQHIWHYTCLFVYVSECVYGYNSTSILLLYHWAMFCNQRPWL